MTVPGHTNRAEFTARQTQRTSFPTAERSAQPLCDDNGADKRDPGGELLPKRTARTVSVVHYCVADLD
eukprot:7427918-Pyramimonas_sp.AAC.1